MTCPTHSDFQLDPGIFPLTGINRKSAMSSIDILISVTMSVESLSRLEKATNLCLEAADLRVEEVSGAGGDSIHHARPGVHSSCDCVASCSLRCLCPVSALYRVLLVPIRKQHCLREGRLQWARHLT